MLKQLQSHPELDYLDESPNNTNGTFLNGHQITTWKDIWRCTIVGRERFLPGECPIQWAHLELEADEYFYPQWGWEECWAVPAWQCANESHLTGCPRRQEAAPQRTSSYLRTKREKKNQDFKETIWNPLHNLLLFCCIKYLTYITVHLLNTGWECFRNGQASNTQTYRGKVSQLPHCTAVGVLLFKIYFGRIPNHSQDSRTATSLYPRVPVKLYFLNNWYLYILYENKYNDGPSHYKFPLYFLLSQKHPALITIDFTRRRKYLQIRSFRRRTLHLHFMRHVSKQ